MNAHKVLGLAGIVAAAACTGIAIYGKDPRDYQAVKQYESALSQSYGAMNVYSWEEKERLAAIAYVHSKDESKRPSQEALDSYYRAVEIKNKPDELEKNPHVAEWAAKKTIMLCGIGFGLVGLYALVRRP